MGWHRTPMRRCRTPSAQTQPRAAAGAGRRASALLDPRRTKKERIRLDDCKDVIELMDEVQQGKQRATLAAESASSASYSTTATYFLVIEGCEAVAINGCKKTVQIRWMRSRSIDDDLMTNQPTNPELTARCCSAPVRERRVQL